MSDPSSSAPRVPREVPFTAAEVAAACGLDYAPTPEQEDIITAPLSSMLVVAGAGSGKTETMAARVVWLIANDLVAPEEVLGLTFTRKAAAELAERIGTRLRALTASGMWTPPLDADGAVPLETNAVVSTYHSYAGRIVSEHGVRLGREPDSRLLTEAAAWQYAAQAVSRYDGPMDDITHAESTVITAVLDLAGELAEHLRSTEDVRAHLDGVVTELGRVAAQSPTGRLTKPGADLLAVMRARRALLPIVDAYAQLKRSHDVMDFADQVALAARLARTLPQVGRLERDRFRVVLLDEFQDTSEAQLRLLEALYAAPDGWRPVTAVGDPHQSIYGWRGASATTLAQFPLLFPRCGPAAPGSTPDPALVRPLATSWRNDRAILAVANVVSAPLRESSEVQVRELVASPRAAAGRVVAARFGTHLEEADHIALWFKQEGAGTERSAAVLCRKRSQFTSIVDALERHGVPYEVVGLGGLLLTPEVQDVVALLRVAQDPSRGDALMRLLTGPVARLGPADLDGLAAWARHLQRQAGSQRGGAPRDGVHQDDEVSIVDALDDLPDAGWTDGEGRRLSAVALGRLGELGAAVRTVRGLAGLPLAELVGEAERALGIDIEVVSRPGYSLAAARTHLDALADVAAGFAASAQRPTLTAFLAWLDAALKQERGLDAGVLDPVPGAVQVLTVHAAKGLEWDLVAVPGLVHGTFPARDGGLNSSFAAEADDGEHADGGWRVGAYTPAGVSGGLAGLPHELRGDEVGLPSLRWSGAASPQELADRIGEFRTALGEHALLEERRLAYVAVTRARHSLLLTSHVWGTQKTPRITAPVLREVCDLCETRSWAAMPEGPDPERPEVGDDRAVLWPVPRDAERLATIDAASRAVRDAGRMAATGAGVTLPDTEHGRLAALLLAERDRDERAAADRRAGRLDLDRPTHLSASDVVALSRNSRDFALSLRRPMPQPPSGAARAGTAFHAWVEAHYRRAAFVDVDELPGSADEDAVGAGDLARLKETFLASEWADQVPLEIELPIETVLDGIAVRGRIDAVFPRDDGGATVVDWKTGRPPTGAEAEHRRLQLAVYVTAYARLTGTDPARVDGAFFYAGTGETVRPDLPPVAEALAALPGPSLDDPPSG